MLVVAVVVVVVVVVRGGGGEGGGGGEVNLGDSEGKKRKELFLYYKLKKIL
jgi:hypothetical protein